MREVRLRDIRSEVFGVVGEVVAHEGGDKVVRVVVAFVVPQGQRDTLRGASLLEGLGLQLFGQEVVGRSYGGRQPGELLNVRHPRP